MKTAATILAVIAIFVALIIGVPYCNLKYTEFFSPKFQNVERQVFEETKSYNQGKTQELAKYFDEYTRGKAEDKEAIASVIRIKFADYKADRLEYGLQQFLIQIRGY